MPSLQSLINSPLGIGLILGIGKALPPRWGFKLADRMGTRLAEMKDSPMVRATRANLWIATGKKLSSRELDELVLDNLQFTANSLYDFYHHINDHDVIRKRVTLSPKLREYLETRIGKNEGTIMLAPHLSNFDLGGRAIALNAATMCSRFPIPCPRRLPMAEPIAPRCGYQYQTHVGSNIAGKQGSP